MSRKIELLAPGGDVDSIKAAIAAGADAIYCGLNRFNARNRAKNITIDELNGILRLAHNNGCEVFLTLNIIIVESEIPAIISLLNKLVNTRIDGIIIQDLGLFYLLCEKFKDLKIHASTQLTTHNAGHIHFLNELSATRVNLSRELSVREIKELALVAHADDILTEVFVHGSHCISFSGICYFSSVHGGNSGNRGRCSQPCRDQYITPPEGANYPLNLKDNSAFSFLRELADAGVDSIKIEGRIKKFHYVYAVVDAWRKQLIEFQHNNKIDNDNSVLHKVFNRGFSNSYLEGDINKWMFIDNPRDNSALHLSEKYGCSSKKHIQLAKQELYDDKTDIINDVNSKISRLSIKQAPVSITITGAAGTPLKISVHTPNSFFVVLSVTHLEIVAADSSGCNDDHKKTGSSADNPGKCTSRKNSGSLDYESLSRFLQTINDSEYFIEHLEVGLFQHDLFLPFHELNSLKKDILFRLNGSKSLIAPQAVPELRKRSHEKIRPGLSVLISSRKDVRICDGTDADVYFQLPSCFTYATAEYLELFQKNTHIAPWFPSILIGEDYNAAVEFLHRVQPQRIVTNNTGIAYEAHKREIPWIAGPYLNIVNSYSLLCLKEKFNCLGAFISNELNRYQIKSIQPPDNFNVYYSIYHPILLMTSRQCLFHQVIGCEKNRIDCACIQSCEKKSSITNLNQVSLVIEKSKHNYHSVYNGINFLNTDIIADIPDRFSSFFIDLRRVETETHVDTTLAELVHLFDNTIHGKPDSIHKLHKIIQPSICSQYTKGI
ncbi:MAG: U32 family peptidase [Gammaproteobacteria bacterium]|nr:U32 family peptidase [Gammaproteobacteria bacterium]